MNVTTDGEFMLLKAWSDKLRAEVVEVDKTMSKLATKRDTLAAICSDMELELAKFARNKKANSAPGGSVTPLPKKDA